MSSRTRISSDEGGSNVASHGAKQLARNAPTCGQTHPSSCLVWLGVRMPNMHVLSAAVLPQGLVFGEYEKKPGTESVCFLREVDSPKPFS
mmetsp:Transcript_43778/g.115638  ORF Transcript_43778/g.115638 Transcript_43778/m.115638 type:complete len:90 (+) Transcript_43778:416-685(+)